MPRAQQSRESAIVNYFKTADLVVAVVVLKLVTDEVRARQTKSSEARARAQGSKPAPAAPARVAPPAAAAAKKGGKKKGGKKRSKPAGPAASAPIYTQDDINGD